MTRWLARAAVLLAAVSASGCSREPAPPAPATNPAPVVIIGLDTFRGDHMGAAGSEVATPYLDALAADGVLFTECQTTAPWTGPAFASLFTGLLPYNHGFLGGDYGRLDHGFTTLAEVLAVRGYDTASYVTVKWLTEFFGLDQGFGILKSFYEPGTGRAAPEVTGRSLEFARGGREGPFLLFSHYFNAHAPYTPPAPFDGLYYEGDPRAPGEPVLDFLMSDRVRLLAREQNANLYQWLEGVTDLDYGVKQYAADVTFTDDSVGRLLDGLRESGLYDKALIVAVGDHGEHLGEHGFWFTHALPYRETMHVPLIIKWPGGAHAGTVVERPVSIADVMPTILSVLGVEADLEMDGVDLSRLPAGGTAPPSPTLAEQGNDPRNWTKALVESGWKLILTKEDGASRAELYDTNADPYETRDLAGELPELTAQLTERLWRICGERRLTAAAALPTLDLSARDRERLRSLGYVH